MPMIDFRPKCPKCRKTIGVLYFSDIEKCPHCGVNMQQAMHELFAKEEKKAERMLARMIRDEKKNQKMMRRKGYEGPRFAAALAH